MNFTSGQSWTLVPRPRVLPNKALHGSGVDRFESCSRIADELVRAGKADLRIVNAEGRHALKQANGVRHGYFEVWLLQPVAKACVEQLDFSGCFMCF